MKKNLLILVILLFFSFTINSTDYCQFSKCLKGIIELKNSIIVVLDPGHGGYEKGAHSSSSSGPGWMKTLYESDLTFPTVYDIRDKLIDYGITNVFITTDIIDENDFNSSDPNIRLQARADAMYDIISNFNSVFKESCNNLDPICFYLSIHLNAPATTNPGTEQYYQYFDGNSFPGQLQNALVNDICLGNRGIFQKNWMIFNRLEELQSENINVQHAYSEVAFIAVDSDLARFIACWDDIVDIYASKIASNLIEKIKKYWNECINKENDTPDDNYSYSDGYFTNIPKVRYDSKIAMPIEFINTNTLQLLAKNKESVFFTLNDFSADMVSEHPVLIIPSGQLSLVENDSILKVKLEQYVKNGGTVIVLGQQYGSHIDNVVPVPEGESLHAYGWREDQSCTANATYMASMHPALASQSTRTVAGAVDGYFDIYPSTATVLLRKTANQEPVLLHYPYGQGTVILTSMYTDWGAAHSQASTSELRLVRDLITFAKKPNQTIPMHRLTQTEPVQINLALKIRNDSEFPTAKAKIKALSPDRKIVLYESEQSLTLTAGAEGDMPISFSVAYTSAVLYGICHVDYELYDAGGNLLQMMSEADTGRFALYPIEINTNTPAQKAAWLTVDTEEAIYGMPITFTLHVSNPTDKVIEGSFCYSWGHNPCFNSFYLSIPAGQTIEKKIEVNYFYYEMYGRFRVFGPEGLYANKGIRFVSPQTKSNVSMIGPTALKVGTPFQYSIRSLNQFPQAMDVNLVLKLMKWTKGQVEDNGYATVATLLDTTGHLEKGGSYQNSGSYIPEQFVFSGYYMLRLEVTTPDRVREIYYSPHFSYIRSSMSIGVQPLAGAIEAGYQTISKILIPGNEYPFQFNIANRSAFAIENGKYSVVVSTEQGQEAFRKEIEGLIFTTGESKSLTENIVFHPPLPGIYYVKVLYSDETGTAYNVKSGAYYSGFSSHVSTQQSSIRYGETLRVNIALQGAGTYIINALAKDEGFSQEKTVQLSEENNFSTTEFFDIPALLENYFKSGPIGQNLQVLVTITNTSAYCEGIPLSRICRDSDLISVKRVPLVVYASGTFSTLSAHVGDPLEFTFNMVGTSGFVAPLNGELRVQSSGLAFNETRVVAISPTGNNKFVFSIPLSSTIAAGQYEVTADIIIVGRSIYSDNYAIKISAPGMKFSTPPPTINAGSELPLDFINDGGKDGVYDIQIIVIDAMGRQVAALSRESIGIAAGASHHEALALPAELKSGQYFLQQDVNEKQTGVTASDRGGFSVIGQSLELQAYTLKEKYFDNEPITAKADLTAGGNGAEGRLQARAVRLSEKEVSVDTITPGDYGTVNSGFSGAKGYNGKLYFASGSPATLKSYDLATGEVSDLLIQCGGGFKISEDGAFVYAIYFGYSSMPTRIFEVNLATREKREISCPSDAQYANDIFRSSTGEYWFWRSSESWIYRRGVDGSFTKYTWTKSSLNSIYQIYQVKENKIGSYSGIWIGTETGVMAFRNGVFSRYYVSLYYIYYCGLDVDSSGDVRFAYRTTTDGYHLKKFNGTSLVEEALPFPGNTGYEYPLPFSLNDGSFWLFRSSSQTLYRQQNGVWQERPLTAVDPSVHSAELMQNMTSGGDFWLTGLVTDPATNNEVNALFHYSAATDQFEKFTASEHRYLQNEVSGITAYNHP
jgi:N-acetylmuramoyl-L-alanine amidase